MINNEKLLSIILVVCGVSKDAFYSDKRGRQLVLARHLYCYISRVKLGLKLVVIASFIKRDHTSVMHGIKTITNLLSVNDQEVQNLYLSIIEAISKEYKSPASFTVECPNGYTAQELCTMLERDYNCKISF
jgi:chromosomal replication initiation ATPase DnaA